MSFDNHKKFKILVTDDDSNILYAFKEVLLKDGHSFLQASNAGQALSLIKKDKPDIIFMDYQCAWYGWSYGMTDSDRSISRHLSNK